MPRESYSRLDNTLALVSVYHYYCEPHRGGEWLVPGMMAMICSLRSRQVGAIHTLCLYSAMSDVSCSTSSCGRRASAPKSQES
jgi:hypothetical protein